MGHVDGKVTRKGQARVRVPFDCANYATELMLTHNSLFALGVGQKWHTTRANQARAHVDGPFGKMTCTRQGRVRVMGLVLLAQF